MLGIEQSPLTQHEKSKKPDRFSQQGCCCGLHKYKVVISQRLGLFSQLDACSKCCLTTNEFWLSSHVF